jgi:hypothetical protein
MKLFGAEVIVSDAAGDSVFFIPKDLLAPLAGEATEAWLKRVRESGKRLAVIVNIGADKL